MPQFQENISLAGLTNYKIGGPAAFFFEAKNSEEVLWAVQAAKKKKTDFFVLGAGTNILVPDEGFAGLVLRPNINFLTVDGTTIHAGVGVLMADVVSAAAKAGLSGLEWAGGLPGTLGGAIRGNAGAFKGEIKDVVHEVESLDTRTMDFLKRDVVESKFLYRSSIFKERGGDEIILSVTLKLKKGDPAVITKAVQEKISYRLARHPMEYPNVGSIFKNVDVEKFKKSRRENLAHIVKLDPFPVVPTAYLISESGLKGVSFGGAMVSPKHPNFIVNTLNAKAHDVRALISLVKGTVAEKFDVDLEEEVYML